MQRFEEQDSEEILRRALVIDARQRGSDREAMIAAAKEMGISDEALAQAEEQWRIEREEKAHLREFLGQQRASFMGHLGMYLMFTAFFFFLDIRGGSLSWFYWPTLGWGIGVACHAFSVLNTKSSEFQREFRRWRKKRRALEE